MDSMTTKLCEAVNELGNQLTRAGWPAGETAGIEYDTGKAFRELVIVAGNVAFMESDLRDCVNELCLRCGQYRNEHLGACDGCRWKAVRHGG